MRNCAFRKIAFLSLLLFGVSATSSLQAADAALKTEVQALFANGVWDRALSLLEQAPDAQTDPEMRELLATAYLYTASRLDSMGNLAKAQELMKQIVDQGGKARFYASLGHDKKREIHLVEATPGMLTVTGGYVEFQPQDGSSAAPQRWEKASITECALNPKYGKGSNSFHLTTEKDKDKTELYFRPLHFSAEESNLICSLIGAPATGGK